MNMYSHVCICIAQWPQIHYFYTNYNVTISGNDLREKYNNIVYT